ncbi:MAG: hypothetical protein GWN09_09655 [Gammaproteobacteria bacterium]|nr:hypothetical protein [Gammaproteobacteria bacterium]
MGREAGRIRFLVERDGREAARKWVEETLKAYRDAVHSPSSHASKPNYKPLFEESIREFEKWLAEESQDRD